jgi:tight adherence protein B
MFLVYVAIFIGVLLVVDGLRQLIFRQETKADIRNRRMRMIHHGASTDDVLQLLRDPAQLQAGSKGSVIVRMRRLLVQAGLTIGVFWFLVLVVMFGGIVFAVAARFIAPDYAALGAATAALIVPLFVLLSLKEERAKKLTGQLPEALDLMARALKVGHPLSVTVANVAKDMADPIGSEFGIIQDQINYGDDVTTAFRDFAERVGTEDAKYLAVSVGIQHGTGGNLARVLNVLSKVIRDRHTMRKKIKAISAEGRLSGIILSVLPVGIFLSIHLTTPSFYGDVQHDPLFRPFAFAIVGLMVAQAFILYRLVKFKF